MLTPVRNVVFDLGGVLIDYDLQRCLDSFRKLGFTQIDRYVNPIPKADFCTNWKWYSYSCPVVCHDWSWSRISYRSTTDWRSFVQFLIDIPDYKLDMLRDLRRQGYRVFMLSNTNVIMFEWMKQHVFKNRAWRFWITLIGCSSRTKWRWWNRMRRFSAKCLPMERWCRQKLYWLTTEKPMWLLPLRWVFTPIWLIGLKISGLYSISTRLWNRSIDRENLQRCFYGTVGIG